MPKNNEGEFELVLGNRQLLSVFFIIVILLGVFFTMGYIVGRNSAPQTADSTPPSKNSPTVVDTPARPVEPAPAPAVEQQAPAVEPAKPAPEPEPAAPAKSAAPAKAAEPTKAAKADKGRPVAGQAYLQLAATSRHEAEIMVDVLRKKGFRSLIAEIEERPGTFRVLVGPVVDNTTNKIRADLQSAGFPGNAAIRRTF